MARDELIGLRAAPGERVAPADESQRKSRESPHKFLESQRKEMKGISFRESRLFNDLRRPLGEILIRSFSAPSATVLADRAVQARPTIALISDFEKELLSTGAGMRTRRVVEGLLILPVIANYLPVIVLE